MNLLTLAGAALTILLLGNCTELNPTFSPTEAGFLTDSGQRDFPAGWEGHQPGDGPRKDGPRPPTDGPIQPSDKGTTGPACTAPTNRGLHLFFIGNSFTLGGPIPTMVSALAKAAGFPAPQVEYSAYGGYTLAQHRKTSSSVNGVAKGSWDFVVLQEYSTGPTDNAGNPTGFKQDATWFYDKTREKSPQGWVTLYETWARHKDHGIYPKTFKDPQEMQAQLRKHYNDAAKNYIPKHAAGPVKDHVRVAPAGDAWERHLKENTPLRLHDSDDYHAGKNGQYLNAAVIFSTLYGCRAKGLDSLGLPPADAARLQDSADATTGIKGIPPGTPPPDFKVSEAVHVDFGSIKTSTSNWNNVTTSYGSLTNAVTSKGVSTTMDLAMTDSFSGSNTSGPNNNKLGWPSSVSQDTLYCGASSTHSAALNAPAAFELRQLPAGIYKLELFASRNGKDGPRDRLTRFTVGNSAKDVEAADNLDKLVVYNSLKVGTDGKLGVKVAVSPAGTGRFCYLNGMVLTRVK